MKSTIFRRKERGAVTRVYLIRHGETEFNKLGRMQGWADAPLTEEGRKQAQAVAERFRDIPLTGVYASDLSRAAVR